MKHKFRTSLLGISAAVFLLSSCSAGNLVVSQVDYQSVRTSYAQPKEVPQSAKIVVRYLIGPSGTLMVLVNNNTDKIMTIDQTKSFIVNTDGVSTSYYDPTVHTKTSGTSTTTSSGTSINLGAIAGIFGIGSSLLSGIGIYNGESAGNFSSSTVTIKDQPQIHVAPHGQMVMSKEFRVYGIGHGQENSYIDVPRKTAPLKFSVCISYALEDEPMDKMVTDFYVNTSYSVPVNNGKVNSAFRQIYEAKPDALAENLYMFNINNNIGTSSTFVFFDEVDGRGIYDKYVQGSLIDYK